MINGTDHIFLAEAHEGQTVSRQSAAETMIDGSFEYAHGRAEGRSFRLKKELKVYGNKLFFLELEQIKYLVRQQVWLSKLR